MMDANQEELYMFDLVWYQSARSEESFFSIGWVVEIHDSDNYLYVASAAFNQRVHKELIYPAQLYKYADQSAYGYAPF